MVICLELSANDLHVVRLMPLPPHHLVSLKSRMVPAYPGSACSDSRLEVVEGEP